MSLPHEWGPSRLNHGEQQCIHCHCTNREAALALGPVCSVRGKKPQESGRIRKIVEASDARYTNPKLTGTLIRLDCGHERHLGGNVMRTLHGATVKITKVSHILGMEYRCKDGMCGR